ncbi:DUF2974 domain-containing protein [Clostridium chromiireducens]|uniref:DUF2974 domain-containing protein n=1 Tax=Clostridium chromiireducens TaxID=225345 RepID=A0A964RMV5_9CLOT|nr:DUF2974 domain-containing protein [Clostridium chromiireducens]
MYISNFEELILLDILISLEWNAYEDEKLIDIVKDLISNGDFEYLMDEIGDCTIKMLKSDWLFVLEKILSNQRLIDLRIKNVDEYYKNGMKYVCLVDQENNAIVVFRGTATTEEWEDNGQGAYEYETKEQIDALNFINGLNYEKITVTGHSKGGNKAQYTAVLSPKVTKCISINGQGFSNEFINKYSFEISRNEEKIISINAKYDYVSCLFNNISNECHYLKTLIQTNPFDYHKAHILLDPTGGLRPETDEAIISNIINKFSTYIISDLPKDVSKLVVDRVIDIVEMVLCRDENGGNIFQEMGKYLLMECYESSVEYKEIFSISFVIAEVLILPLLFWSDLILAEETKSKDVIKDIINKIIAIGESKIIKLKLIDKTQINLIDKLSKAIHELTERLEKEI